jgi:hypothetical protein
MNRPRTSIWLGAWDVNGRQAGQLLDELTALGVDSCSLSMAYHGGRLLLGNHPRRVVYEQPLSGLFFEAQLDRFAPPKPAIAEEAAAVRTFLAAAARRGFPVEAWTVLCHNDRLGSLDSSLCLENAFGERYSYALCPANPRVQDYCAELCRQIAEIEGISGIDLEAASFMGYEHASLHDKCGAHLAGSMRELLSVCLCPYCRAGLGAAAEPAAAQVREQVRHALRGGEAAPLPEDLAIELLAHRDRAQITLLRAVRAAVGATRLNLRLAGSRTFTGGKCSLPATEALTVADEITCTFFGDTEAQLEQGLSRLPEPARAGIVFHGPDCSTAGDVVRRIALVRASRATGVSLYGYSLAQNRHLEWLRMALEAYS